MPQMMPLLWIMILMLLMMMLLMFISFLYFFYYIPISHMKKFPPNNFYNNNLNEKNFWNWMW